MPTTTIPTVSISARQTALYEAVMANNGNVTQGNRTLPEGVQYKGGGAQQAFTTVKRAVEDAQAGKVQIVWEGAIPASDGNGGNGGNVQRDRYEIAEAMHEDAPVILVAVDKYQAQADTLSARASKLREESDNARAQADKALAQAERAWSLLEEFDRDLFESAVSGDEDALALVFPTDEEDEEGEQQDEDTEAVSEVPAPPSE